MFTSLGDLFKWGRNFSNNILGKGKKNLIDRVLSPGVQINDDIGYGFGINVGKVKGKKFFGHYGAIHGYTSSMMHFPEENVMIVCLSNHNQEGSWTYRDRIMEMIFPADNPMVLPIQQPHPKKFAVEEQNITGMYQDTETASIWEVFCTNGSVAIRVNNHWEFELSYVQPLVYRVVQPEMELVFEPDSTGRIRAIKGTDGERSFTYMPFMQNPLSFAPLSAAAIIFTHLRGSTSHG